MLTALTVVALLSGWAVCWTLACLPTPEDLEEEAYRAIHPEAADEVR